MIVLLVYAFLSHLLWWKLMNSSNGQVSVSSNGAGNGKNHPGELTNEILL